MSRSDVLVSTHWAEHHLATPHVVFVDVDEDVSAHHTGHVSGALNVPWSKAATDDGTFKSDEELRAISAGIDRTKPAIASCRIGERSSHTWFVLRELPGPTNVTNCDGSWTEYGSLVAVPVARGAE